MFWRKRPSRINFFASPQKHNVLFAESIKNLLDIDRDTLALKKNEKNAGKMEVGRRSLLRS